MIHDRAWNRAKSWAHAIKKRKLDKNLTPPLDGEQKLVYDNLHQYSKNKIKENPIHDTSNAAKNCSFQNMKQQEDEKEQLKELTNE